jgi:hypothetical protein
MANLANVKLGTNSPQLVPMNSPHLANRSMSVSPASPPVVSPDTGDMLIGVEELGEGSSMEALSLADDVEGFGLGTATPLSPSEDKGSSSAAASGPAFGSVDMGDDLFDQESGKTACLCQNNCSPETALR